MTPDEMAAWVRARLVVARLMLDYYREQLERQP